MTVSNRVQRLFPLYLPFPLDKSWVGLAKSNVYKRNTTSILFRAKLWQKFTSPKYVRCPFCVDFSFFIISGLVQERYRCARQRRCFVANHPFLYLLTVRQIPVFIGVYEGTEYVQTCSDETEPTRYLHEPKKEYHKLEKRPANKTNNLCTQCNIL